MILAITLQPISAEDLKLYSHGNPTAEEQYMLELINRARANPAMEGRTLAETNDPDIKLALDYFNVDLPRLRSDFKSYPVRPPLAFNASLIASSRRHSRDMAKHNFQAHTGSDGSTVGSRIAEAGFPGMMLNESIYSDRVPSTIFAHDGFNVDWGTGPRGVQPDLGHRDNIMSFGPTVYREVGIGVVGMSAAHATAQNKLAITQDFGIRIASPDFLVGVAYYDVNNNGLCDPGEGIPSIKVTPATGDSYAVTSSSGGYAIPFSSAPGKSTVIFSGGGLAAPQRREFSINGENAKVDLRITSGPPVVFLQKGDGTAREGGSSVDKEATFKVVRVGPVGGELKVSIFRPMTAVPGRAQSKDYEISGIYPATTAPIRNADNRFTVVIPKNARSATVKVTAIADKLIEPTELAEFTLGGSRSYRKGDPHAVAISITP